MTDRVDPLESARGMARALGESFPAVPTTEVDLARDASARLTRLRLGQVAEHGWVPSLAIVGRRGVGKSSLAMELASFASTGAAHATSLAALRGGGVALVHDTPGLRAAGSARLREQLGDALRDDPPDVVLAAFSATEVDAGIDDDLDDLRALLRAWTPRRSAAPALVAALHRADELPPFDREARVDDPERVVAVQTATRVLRARLSPIDGLCPIVTTSVVAGAPLGLDDLAAALRGALAGRLGTERSRDEALRRALSRADRGDLAARWGGLAAGARSIALHPRGWATSEGRGERG